MAAARKSKTLHMDVKKMRDDEIEEIKAIGKQKMKDLNLGFKNVNNILGPHKAKQEFVAMLNIINEDVLSQKERGMFCWLKSSEILRRANAHKKFNNKSFFIGLKYMMVKHVCRNTTRTMHESCTFLEKGARKSIPVGVVALEELKRLQGIKDVAESRLKRIQASQAKTDRIVHCKSLRHKRPGGCPHCGVMYIGPKNATERFIRSVDNDTGQETLINLNVEIATLAKEEEKQIERVKGHTEVLAEYHRKLHYEVLTNIQHWWCLKLNLSKCEVTESRMHRSLFYFRIRKLVLLKNYVDAKSTSVSLHETVQLFPDYAYEAQEYISLMMTTKHRKILEISEILVMNMKKAVAVARIRRAHRKAKVEENEQQDEALLDKTRRLKLTKQFRNKVHILETRKFICLRAACNMRQFLSKDRYETHMRQHKIEDEKTTKKLERVAGVKAVRKDIEGQVLDRIEKSRNAIHSCDPLGEHLAEIELKKLPKQTGRSSPINDVLSLSFSPSLRSVGSPALSLSRGNLTSSGGKGRTGVVSHSMEAGTAVDILTLERSPRVDEIVSPNMLTASSASYSAYSYSTDETGKPKKPVVPSVHWRHLHNDEVCYTPLLTADHHGDEIEEHREGNDESTVTTAVSERSIVTATTPQTAKSRTYGSEHDRMQLSSSRRPTPVTLPKQGPPLLDLAGKFVDPVGEKSSDEHSSDEDDDDDDRQGSPGSRLPSRSFSNAKPVRSLSMISMISQRSVQKKKASKKRKKKTTIFKLPAMSPRPLLDSMIESPRSSTLNVKVQRYYDSPEKKPPLMSSTSLSSLTALPERLYPELTSYISVDAVVRATCALFHTPLYHLELVSKREGIEVSNTVPLSKNMVCLGTRNSCECCIGSIGNTTSGSVRRTGTGKFDYGDDNATLAAISGIHCMIYVPMNEVNKTVKMKPSIPRYTQTMGSASEGTFGDVTLTGLSAGLAEENQSSTNTTAPCIVDNNSVGGTYVVSHSGVKKVPTKSTAGIHVIPGDLICIGIGRHPPETLTPTQAGRATIVYQVRCNDIELRQQH